MKIYEYKLVEAVYSTDGMNAINELAKDGWRVCGSTHSNFIHHWTLEREKEQSKSILEGESQWNPGLLGHEDSNCDEIEQVEANEMEDL